MEKVIEQMNLFYIFPGNPEKILLERIILGVYTKLTQQTTYER